MRKLLLLISLLTPTVALAAGGGIPGETVVNQVANLSILIVILYLTQRKTIAQAFADKKQTYLDDVAKSSQFKTDAEAKLKEVSARVSDMEKTFEQQVTEAKNNAEESYRSQLANAKNEAERLMTAAEGNLEFELQKEVENLRVEAFKKSADLAEKNLEKSMTPDQLKAWNNHFATAKEGAH